MTKRKIHTIVTPTEKKFKEHLQKHLPANIEIHCKVRFADILRQEITDKLNIWKDKKIYMMHIDFTLVIKETQEIILAIELDDYSHKREKTKLNDDKKKEMLTESKLHYARVKVEEMYDMTIINKIVNFCKKKAGKSHVPASP